MTPDLLELLRITAPLAAMFAWAWTAEWLMTWTAERAPWWPLRVVWIIGWSISLYPTFRRTITMWF